MTSKQRKWQIGKLERGLCAICGKAAASHKEYCDLHYAAVLEKTRKWYWEHGGKERKKQYYLAKKNAAEHALHPTSGDMAAESELDKPTKG
jgi:hypothetical protein